VQNNLKKVFVLYETAIIIVTFFECLDDIVRVVAMPSGGMMSLMSGRNDYRSPTALEMSTKQLETLNGSERILFIYVHIV
jgi:hypothetical protein